ncbi:MAG: Fe(3+)-siderophore ABC transporter permease, partial [Vibrionaceae bacterium]
YDVLWPVTLLVAFGLALSMALRQALNTVSLGQDLGEALGANPQRVWLLASSVIVVLSGAATSAAGPLSFVGLTAPHLARFLVGPDHRWLLPYSMLIAALLTVVADILGRVIGYPDEISVGIMVALIGGPFFVVLVRKWKIAQL